MTPAGPEDGGRELRNSADPSFDRWLELLANRDRRLVLSTLIENGDDRLPVGVLTDVIARKRPEDVTPQSVLIELHHVHLPKLHRADAIEYDPDESLVTYRGHDGLERCLRAVRDAAAD
ncbi:DUF7344 domain-containing protein [Halorientalis pallida]|uniref:DUF7344 domain-containing protein n=1 Tax=Halorientalis pallida TaxID=2479928 RepID=A0A498KWS8_9EURY|nr:hypothetical protein [Halorientalis pallida]RXK50080.1 hypothetical protein EAF64_05810 [Halorientalis pallida]